MDGIVTQGHTSTFDVTVRCYCAWPSGKTSTANVVRGHHRLLVRSVSLSLYIYIYSTSSNYINWVNDDAKPYG